MEIEYPKRVAVETTNRCNAKCSFCPNRDLARERRLMSDDLFRKIIDDCRAFPLPAIEPFLQGEPFMDPKIFDRLAYINQQLPRTALTLYSNGAALTPHKSDQLRSLNIARLNISLNTIDPDKYRRIVGLPFERTLANLRHLARCQGSDKRPVAAKIVVRMTLVADTTREEVARFRELCRELRVKAMTVAQFNYKGDLESRLPVPRYPCEHIRRLDILSSGETTLCCQDQEGAYGWGNVIDHSVLEVFNSERARRVRHMQRTGQRADLEPCNRCTVFWPSLAHLSPKWKIRHAAACVTYFVKNRPRAVRAAAG